MKSRIFLAYSKADTDSELVRLIDLLLSNRGMEVHAYGREDPLIGEPIKKYIDEQIKQSDYVAFLISDMALMSMQPEGWIAFELETAAQYQKHFFAIKPKVIALNRLPKQLQDREFIEYSTANEVIRELSKKRSWIDRGIDVYIPGAGFGGSEVEFSPDIPKLLYPIGNKPMLFHVIDSLAYGGFRKVIVINKKDMASELIEYLTSLVNFPVEVECKQTEKKTWPAALQEIKPTGTFLLQLCDVILDYSSEIDKTSRWKEVIEQHVHNLADIENYLGTLIVSTQYKIAAGKVTFGTGNMVANVEENPKTNHLCINTGTALLEPELLDYVKFRDASILGGAVEAAMETHGKRFGCYNWVNWHHLLNPNDWKNHHNYWREELSKIQSSRVTSSW